MYKKCGGKVDAWFHIYKEIIQEKLLTSVQIPKMLSTSVSSKKCHCTNDFVLKISSLLGYSPFCAIKFYRMNNVFNGVKWTEP
mgnify:CR=1 FL=1